MALWQTKVFASLAACIASSTMLFPHHGYAMDMRLESETLFLSGGVVNSDCDAFEQLLAKGEIKKVVFERSPGGAVSSGYCVGNRIRKHNLTTILQGSCASACSLMWLGGVERTLVDNKSRLGMHGIGNDVGTSDGTRGGELYQYIVGMAPSVDRKLVDEWAHFKGLSMIMNFYKDRAETCRGRGIECTPISGRNVLNVGLATK